MNTKPVYYNEIQNDEILQFIADEWGPRTDGFISHEIDSEYVHTDIQLIGGNGEEKTFVTFGVGARKMNSPIPNFNRIELLMYASSDMNTDFSNKSQNAHIVACAELTSLSKYPFRNDTWFGPGHTINASKRFEEKFGYQYFIFVEHPNIANISGVGEVHFLVAIPVYEEERDWMANHENGSQRFLDKYVSEYEINDAVDDMFMIDLERNVIIPSECEE